MCTENIKRIGLGWCAAFSILIGFASLAQARVSYPKGGEARNVRSQSKDLSGPNLDSTRVHVAECPADHTNKTRQCDAEGGYTVVETHSDMSNFRFVVKEGTAFQTFLEPARCERAEHTPRIEVRRYEGRPFAVIQRVDCHRLHKANARKKPRPYASYFVVRGLQGFEDLKAEVKVSKPSRRAIAIADARARNHADDYLHAQWAQLLPEVEAARHRAIEIAFEKQVAAQRALREAELAETEQQEADAHLDALARDFETPQTADAEDDEIVIFINVDE